jgi:hypothetical protein
MRAGGLGRSVRKCAIIFSMAWSTAIERYPKLKRIAAPGRVPRDTGFYKELERTFIQTNKEYDIIEICHYYDLDNMGYVCFAGPTCAILEELKGDKYPFTTGDNKDPYIPILQYMCMPSSEGLYNHGLGDMFFDVAMLSSQLMNMGYNHAADNADPFTLIGVPKGQTATLFNSMRAAGEMRAAGKRPIIPMEFDPANPNASRVSMEALTTQSLVNELELMLSNITREVARMGINLDDVDYGKGVSAHQIVAQESNQNNFTQQMMEYNASETQFAVDSVMDMIVKLVSSKDKTPLNLVGTYETVDESTGQPMQIPADQITLGAVRDELKKFHYFSDINARTGAQPSGLLEQARIKDMLPLTQPGSKAQAKLLQSLAKASSLDLSLEDFMPPAPQPVPTEGPDSAPSGAAGGLGSLPKLAGEQAMAG